MAFCEECGSKLQEADKFCESCGRSVEDLTVSDSPANQMQYNQVQPNQTVTYYQKTPSSINFKLDKKKKIIFGVIAGVLILCFVAFRIGASITDKDKVIEKFSAAITSGDSKQIVSMLKCSDQRVVINEENVKSLFNYIDSNPFYVSDLMRSINKQSQKLDVNKDKEASEAFSSSDSNYSITLKKSGKRLLLFDNYVFEVSPIFINISTNFKDTELFVNDSKVCVSDSDQFSRQVGPYFPGTYIIKSVYKGKYATLQKTSEIEGIQSDNSLNDILNVEMNMEGKYVQIECNEADAKLFVNGLDIGMTVSEINEIGLGPVDNNVKVYAEKKYPWGNIKSNEANVNDGDNYVSLSIERINDDVRNAVITAVSTYEKDVISALTNRDVSKVTNITQNRLNELTSRIDNLISYEQMFLGNIVKQDFDMDSFSIETESSSYYVYVKVHNYYNSVYYYPAYSTDTTLQENNNVSQYKLFYDMQTKKWLIDQDYSGYDISTNIKTIDY